MTFKLPCFGNLTVDYQMRALEIGKANGNIGGNREFITMLARNKERRIHPNSVGILLLLRLLKPRSDWFGFNLLAVEDGRVEGDI